MMARASGELFGLIVALVATARVAIAITFNVGDSYGWTLPSGANGFNYSAWAAQQTFVVGDILHFQYSSGAHSVQPLPSDASFAACDFSVVTVPAFEGGSNDITLKTAGDHWYACSVGMHCQYGMKFKVTVGELSFSPAPAPADFHALSPYSSEGETPAPTPEAGSDEGSYYPNNGAPATYGVSPEPVPYFYQSPAGAPDANVYNPYLRGDRSPSPAPAPKYDFGGSFDGSPDASPDFAETIPFPVSGAN